MVNLHPYLYRIRFQKTGHVSHTVSFTQRRRTRHQLQTLICCSERGTSSAKRLAVFVSGTGSNFRKIHESCLSRRICGDVVLAVTNSPDCPAAQFATQHSIPLFIHPAKEPQASLVETVKNQHQVDFILLAGYLKRIPSDLIQVYPRSILNIHPALLPAFGGKGFYGSKVHAAVLASGAKFSGATVHFVTEEYDEGVILDQRVVPVLQNDDVPSLARRVLQQEHELYSDCVRALCEDWIFWNENGIPFIQQTSRQVLS